MSFIPILLLGSADDGPDGVSILPESLAEAQEIYGWYTTDYKLLLSNTASAMLTYPVWGNELIIYQKIDGRLITSPLYSPAISSSASAVTFGQPGASGEYLFKYVRIPEEDSLVLALQLVMQQGAEPCSCYRIQGTRASVVIGDFTFTAQYSGNKYNGITITVDSNYLTIVDNRTRSHSSTSYPVSGLLSMVAAIDIDNARGIHPLEVTFPISPSPSLPAGNYALSGGVNGSVNESNIEDILSLLDLDDIGIIVLAGGQPSGVIQKAIDYIEANGVGATCLVAGSPVAYKDWSKSDYLDYLNNLPFSSQHLFYSAGWGNPTVIYGQSYWCTLAPIFAGLWSVYSSSPTHKPTSLQQILPVWNSGELSGLKNRFCVFTKFIQTGLSPVSSVPTNGENPLINKVKLDIARRIENTFSSLLGEPSLSLPTINTKTGDALQDLGNVKDLQYQCSLSANTITIVIYLQVYGELETIQLVLVSRRVSNV